MNNRSLDQTTIIDITDNKPVIKPIPNLPKLQGNSSDSGDDLLNLIAEIVVENIVRKIRNGRNRIYQDK